jgi:hypothetical protein
MMGNSGDHRSDRPLVPKVAGNPEGKGDHAFLTDWCATEPRGVVAKPQRRVLAELFTSMLVLSASFKYRPVPGGSNYLYWIDGRWSLSLIAPYEWSDERRAGFAGTCVLQRDMTWTIVFAAMLDTDLTLEEILPFYVGRLDYYQRLFASALSRSVTAAVMRGGQTAISCRQWQMQLPDMKYVLPAYSR